MPIALITGASSGIGRATAIELGRRGYHVVAAGRSAERTEGTLSRIREAGGSAEFTWLDLASLQSVRDAAGGVLDSGRPLDILVNNAGVGMVKGLSVDGFEIHFAINHLGHWLLTEHLGDALRPGGRVVCVSSEVHRRAGTIDFGSLTLPTRSLFGIHEYAMSKLANVLHVRELARRRPDLSVSAVHPGLVRTGILPWYARAVASRRLLTPEQGADTVVWCATSHEVAGQTGLYYSRRTAITPSPPALDDDLGRELWRRSEEWSLGVAAG